MLPDLLGPRSAVVFIAPCLGRVGFVQDSCHHVLLPPLFVHSLVWKQRVVMNASKSLIA